MCTAEMTLLVIQFVNAYSIVKPKQPNNPLLKKSVCLVSAVCCAEARGEILGRSRYPDLGDLSTSGGKLEVNFSDCMAATVAAVVFLFPQYLGYPTISQ